MRRLITKLKNRIPMRILMISKAIPQTYKGGIQTHVWELSRALHKRGHEVSILTAGSLLQGLKHWQSKGVHIYEISYLPTQYVPVLSNTISELSFNLAAVRWVERHASQFDIVHAHGRSGYLYPGVKKRKLPCVTTIHRLYSIEIPWSKSEYKNVIDRHLHLQSVNYFEKIAVNHADAVIAISEEVIKELKSIHAPEEKIHLIYNGVDINIPVQQNKPAGNQLLFVGRLNKIKGIYPLVESMLHVQPDIQLKILGDGAEWESLHHFIIKLGLENRVQLAGRQPAEEVFKQLEQSYALILPSYHESQGIVLMEANLAGKPTLGADVPGINEMIIPGKNGYLFSAGDVAAMANAINQLFDNQEEAERLGAWGREWVRTNFGWEKIAAEVETLYQEVTASKKSRQSVNNFAKEII